MIQFYLLSIVLNALSGYVLIREDGEAEVPPDTAFRWSLQNETTRLILGLATAVMGLLKLLSPVTGDMRVLGDLIPALTGLLSGFALVFGYYRSRSTMEPAHTDKLEHLFIDNKKWVGFIALCTAALHFLFPTVLFL